ncbi:MAG: hypothetical protein BMS9Abin26_1481 [Gammaproteobacteria bacterium]|nr:MAG: hypothetical protein BMS9Abin26_1481 [Gammaproteobacteria bacterium]
MNRYKASLIHFVCSATVIAIYLAIVYFVWYPEPFFTIETAFGVIIILISVDVVLGPLLTFIVYKPDKPRLKMDLSIIVAIQLAAFVWGLSITYSQRPVYVALVGEYFSVVAASDIKTSVPEAIVSKKKYIGPTLVYLDLPKGDELVALIEKARASSRQINTMTELYQPYEEHIADVARQGVDLYQRAVRYPEVLENLNKFLTRNAAAYNDYIFVPIEGRKHIYFLALNRSDGMIAGFLENE